MKGIVAMPMQSSGCLVIRSSEHALILPDGIVPFLLFDDIRACARRWICQLRVNQMERGSPKATYSRETPF